MMTDRIVVVEEKVDTLIVRVDVLADRADVVDRRLDRLTECVDSFERRLIAFQEETRAEFATVRAEIRAGDEETRRYMRVFHEEILDRLRLLGEGRANNH